MLDTVVLKELSPVEFAITLSDHTLIVAKLSFIMFALLRWYRPISKLEELANTAIGAPVESDEEQEEYQTADLGINEAEQSAII